MPQLDIYSFHLQSYFLILSFFIFYFLLKRIFLPNIIQSVVTRNYLLTLWFNNNKIYLLFLSFIYINYKKIINNFFNFIYFSLKNLFIIFNNFCLVFLNKFEIKFFKKTYIYILKKLYFIKKKQNNG